MQIELKEHIGTSRGGKPVDHNQFIVFCDGVQVGYMGKKPGSWLACIVAMDDDTKQELQAAINRTMQEPIGGVAVLPEPEEETDDEELEEEDDD